jgi:hypothetical protein
MAGVRFNASLPAVATALLAALSLPACGGGGNGNNSGVQANADSTTKAAYNDDYDGVTQNFDGNLKQQVTRAEVGILSDRMHRAGQYQGLTFVSSDPNKNEYTYRAGFSNGTMNVVVRLDPDGKMAAYRVLAPEQ